MEKIVDEINELLKGATSDNKAYALHYLLGAIKFDMEYGKTSIPYEKLIKTLQVAIQESKN